MVKVVKLYVEGGGNDSQALKAECRRGFRDFLEKAGLAGHMPRIVACGGRHDAYESYRTAVNNGEAAVLLVDSEASVASMFQSGPPDRWLPWTYLKQRQGDGWEKPEGATDLECHLMVQCMESWFLADRGTLAAFYGRCFKMNALPAVQNAVESVVKQSVYLALADATKGCVSKGQYGKGEHSFKILSLIDPQQVRVASPWADRFIEQIRAIMGAA